MEWIWLGVIISLILVELLSLNFTAIWFVISGIVSFILLELEKDYLAQVMAFLIIGIIFIVIVRPRIIDKLRSKRDTIINKLIDKHPFFINLIPKDLKEKYNNKKNNKKKKK